MEVIINDFISGDKIIKLADYRFNELNSDEEHVIPEYNNTPVIYAHTHHVDSLFKHMKDRPPWILLSHNSDGKITESPNKDDANVNSMPNNLIYWFGQNVQINHPHIESIPIGLENECWFPEQQKQKQINNIIGTSKQYRNLCYMNFNIETNLSERLSVFNMFKNHSWVTTDMKRNGVDFKLYLDHIYNHKFALCPEGNNTGHPTTGDGTNTHRVWECIYCNTIPIILHRKQAEHFKDLPILMINNWDDINEKFLEQKYYEMKTKIYNYNKIKLSYWRSRINEFRNNSTTSRCIANNI